MGFLGGATLAAGLVRRSKMTPPHVPHQGRVAGRLGSVRHSLLRVVPGCHHTVPPTGVVRVLEGGSGYQGEAVLPGAGSRSHPSLETQRHFCHTLSSERPQSPPRAKRRGQRHHFSMGTVPKLCGHLEFTVSVLTSTIRNIY